MANRQDRKTRKVEAAGTSASRPGTLLPRADGNRLPAPIRPPRSIPVAPIATPVVAAAPSVTPARDGIEPAPSAAPPTTAAGTIRRAAEETQIVAPLPSPFEPPKRKRGRAATPRVIVDRALVESGTPRFAARARRALVAIRYSGVGGLIGAAVLVALVAVVAIGFSSDDVTRPPVRREVAEAPEDVTVEPLPSPPARAVPAEPDEIEIPAASEPPVAPRAKALPPAPHEVRAPRPPRSRAKVAPSPRAKAARPMTYDPDALFLKKP